MAKKKASSKPKKRGRPRKAVVRKLSRDEIVKALVEGVVVIDEGREMRHVPSLRELANQHGTSHSYIGRIAQANDCARRHAAFRKAHPEPFDAYDKWEARRRVQEKSKPAREPEPKEPPGPRKRRPGHPSRLDSPVPWNEIDRLLVLGENVELPDGTQSTLYPPLREIGRRFGVAHSAIVKYWRDHHCERRRETARQRLLDKTEEKLLELRATAIAVSKDDALRIIDKFLTKFEQALDDDRVRYDLPGDFNTMLRLKEFVVGGPDSRQETTTTFTLEMLQERHQRMLRETRQLSQAEQGVIEASGQEIAGALESSGEVSGDSSGRSNADNDGDDALEDARTDASAEDDVAAEASPHPPTRPFGKGAGQQTGHTRLSADEEDS